MSVILLWTVIIALCIYEPVLSIFLAGFFIWRLCKTTRYKEPFS